MVPVGQAVRLAAVAVAVVLRELQARRSQAYPLFMFQSGLGGVVWALVARLLLPKTR